MVIRLLSALSVGVFFTAPGFGQSTPPPPPLYAEFFSPTVREHIVSATCDGGAASMSWTFDGQSVHLRAFAIGGRTVDKTQMDQLQAWMSQIGGDVFADIECGGDSAALDGS